MVLRHCELGLIVFCAVCLSHSLETDHNAVFASGTKERHRLVHTDFSMMTSLHISCVTAAEIAPLCGVILVFNLTNGVDVKETEERVAAYRKENESVIKKNRSKLVSNQYCLMFVVRT